MLSDKASKGQLCRSLVSVISSANLQLEIIVLHDHQLLTNVGLTLD